jgi:hypothetical protein
MALAQLVAARVRFEADEAVAVAQQIISASRVDGTAEPVRDPPSLTNVSIDQDGGVVCRGCAMAPSVLDVGKLLETMLPADGPTRVPGALRYTIGRALSEVVAPPFASIAEFAEALKRFEKAERTTVIRQLYARAAPEFADAAPQFAHAAPEVRRAAERRSREPSVAELRRQLREADQDRYLLRLERAVAASAAAPVPDLEETDVVGDWVIERATDEDFEDADGGRFERGGGGRAAAVAVVAVALAFGIGYAGVSHAGWEWVTSVLISLRQMLQQ